MYADLVCKPCDVAWNSFYDGFDCWVCGRRGESGGAYAMGMTVTFEPTNTNPDSRAPTPQGPDPVRNVV